MGLLSVCLREFYESLYSLIGWVWVRLRMSRIVGGEVRTGIWIVVTLS